MLRTTYHHLSCSYPHFVLIISFHAYPICTGTRETFNAFTSFSLHVPLTGRREACRRNSTTKVGGGRYPHDVSILDVFDIWRPAVGHEESQRKALNFCHLCLDGYTNHLIEAPFYFHFVLENGDLGDCMGLYLLRLLFGKPTKICERFDEKQRKMIKARTKLWSVHSACLLFREEFV